MPGLRAFGRRWNIGSEDVIFPAAIQTVVSSSWFLAFSYVFIRHHSSLRGAGGGIIHNLYAGGLLVQGVNLAVLIALMRVSLKGTLINWWPRRHISTLIGCKFAMDVTTVVYTAIATRYAFYGEFPDCETYIINSLKNAVKFSYANIIAGCLSMFLILRPKKAQDSNLDLITSDSALSATAQTWANGFHLLCRIAGLEGHPVLNSLSKVFSIVFKEDVDIVPTDTITALILLEAEQRERISEVERRVLQAPLAKNLHILPWMNPRLACHYLPFAAASYGWPMYIIRSPFASVGLLRVLANSRFIPRSLPEHIVDDNPLLANTTVIKMVTGLKDEDFVHVTFHNKLFEIPFYVALDHKEKSVVVSIRGTLSLEDVLTDLLVFESEQVPIKKVKDASAHQGMTNTARYILQRLVGVDQARDILKREGHEYDPQEFSVFDEKPLLVQAYDKLSLLVGQQTAQEYRVVIVGHSLGAGVAPILAMLLREAKQYQDLWCFAFSPPGGLTNTAAAEYCQQFVCSVVLGDDIVSRLSLHTILSFKERVFQIIKDCDLPKGRVMNTWLKAAINRMIGTKQSIEMNTTSPSWNEDKDAAKIVEPFQKRMQEAITSIIAEREKLTQLCLPGVVMYLHENINKTSWWRTQKSYEVRYVDGWSEVLGEIFLSTEVIRHHTPWAVLEALTTFNQGR